jgi:hypothetical protein
MVQDGLDSAEIAERFTERGIKRTQKAIQRKRERERLADPMGWHAMVAPAPACAPRFDQPLHIEEDRSLILPDPHVPFHDADWCNRVIALALAFRCTTAIVPGDLMDWSALSRWGRQERVEAEDEIGGGRQFLGSLARSFRRVAYTGGNHDMRLARITGNLLELRDTMEMFVRDTNVEITDYHWLELISGGELYYIEHPKNASTVPGRVPAKLAEKLGRHVIGTHGHQWGQVRDVSGRYWAIDAGVCADPLRLAHINKVHSTRPVIYQGAVLILDGVPVLLSPDNIAFYEKMVA